MSATATTTAAQAETAPSPLTQIPTLFRHLIAPFPLVTYPPARTIPKRSVHIPTLWIHPPLSTTPDTKPDLLSRDAECLKWQAHLALRGVQPLAVRWDVTPSGALGTRLPNLQMPDDVLLPAHGIPAWIAERMGGEVGDLEGYRDEKARDESLAWIALLEGDVHAALTLSQSPPSFILSTLLQVPTSTDPPAPEKLLAPPPAPASGLLSLLPPFGTRVPADAVQARYHDAIAALSERLGSDRWFLGSAGPTALDALAFAYVHTLLNSTDELRVQVARRVNLVSWERRVYEQIRGAFVSVDGVKDGLVP